MGSVIERDEPHQRVFEVVRPDINLAHEQAARVAGGVPAQFDANDLYPDARPCLETLHADGYRLGIVGNQPAKSESLLEGMQLPVDFIASSAGWGVHKPDPAFFARIAEELGQPPAEIAYVGDRLDNDVLPAVAAGMVAVFIRRGPWGYIHARRPEINHAQLRITSLAELPAALQRHGLQTPANEGRSR